MFFPILGTLLHAQEKELELGEVRVRLSVLRAESELWGGQEIDSLTLRMLQGEDLSSALQLFPGVRMKNYGGLGGLKTLSFRGVGGAHIHFLQDGFRQNDSQSGQVNFNTVPLDNVTKTSMKPHEVESLLPASSILASQVLDIQTRTGLGEPKTDKWLSVHAGMGSFGLFDQFVDYGNTVHKNKFALSVRNRNYQGGYPYTYSTNFWSTSGVRSNNKLHQINAQTSYKRDLKKNQNLRIQARYARLNQELPGAIILFAPENKQFLHTDNGQLLLDANLQKSAWKIRPFISVRYQNLVYTDSSYLNQQNLLQQNYIQRETSHGITTRRFFGRYSLTLGAEQIGEEVLFTHQNMRVAQRWQRVTSINNQLKFGNWQLALSGGAQFIQLRGKLSQSFENEALPSGKLLTQFSPNKNWSFLYGISYTNRLQTLNELFFGQIANTNLRPEKAFLNQGTVNYHRFIKGWTIHLQGTAHLNYVNDKIIAIPNKNLFVWSILNVARAKSSGVEAVAELSRKWSKSMLYLRHSQSYQQTLDFSSSSITFKQILPYHPIHQSNSTVRYQYKNVGLFLSLQMVSTRYSLPENIELNQLPAFHLLESGMFYSKEIGGKLLKIQVNVRNLTNQNYAYVRSFVMPGINFYTNVSIDF